MWGNLSIVNTFKVSHGYQIIGRGLERIILSRFNGIYMRDRKAKQAERDLLALLEEEEKVEKKKDKKKKKQQQQQQQHADNSAAKDATLSSALDDSVTHIATKEAVEKKNKERRNAQEAAAAERLHIEKVKRDAAVKAEQVEKEAARAHETYMKKLAQEQMEKERRQEEEDLAVAKALSLAQREVEDAEEKKRKHKKEKNIFSTKRPGVAKSFNRKEMSFAKIRIRRRPMQCLTICPTRSVAGVPPGTSRE